MRAILAGDTEGGREKRHGAAFYDFPHPQPAIARKGSGIQTARHDRSRLKAMGRMAGVPDYFAQWHDGKGMSYGFLEAKSNSGRLSEAQKEFREYCWKANVPFATFRAAEEGLNILKLWGAVL